MSNIYIISADISSKKVPVIFKPLFLGTMSLLSKPSVATTVLALAFEVQDSNKVGTVKADAPANVAFFRKSLRSNVFILV